MVIGVLTVEYALHGNDSLKGKMWGILRKEAFPKQIKL